MNEHSRSIRVVDEQMMSLAAIVSSKLESAERSREIVDEQAEAEFGFEMPQWVELEEPTLVFCPNSMTRKKTRRHQQQRSRH